MYYGSIPKCIAWISYQVILQHRYPGGKVQIRPLFLTYLGSCKTIAFLWRASALWYPCLNWDPPTLYTKPLLIASYHTSSSSPLKFSYRGAGWPKATDWRKNYSLFSGFSLEAESHLFRDFFRPVASLASLTALLTLLCLLSFSRVLTSSSCTHSSFLLGMVDTEFLQPPCLCPLSHFLVINPGKIHHLHTRIFLVSLPVQAIGRVRGHHRAPCFTTPCL